jgi:hypothetical protein
MKSVAKSAIQYSYMWVQYGNKVKHLNLLYVGFLNAKDSLFLL